MRRFFVTGTDTEVGKTYVSRHLLRQARQAGHSTLGLKPVAAGCEWVGQQLCNADALGLIADSTLQLDYTLHNPVALEPPVAPHIAAEQAGVNLSLDGLNRWYERIRPRQADLVLIEGAGGWRLPLNQQDFLSGFVQQHGLPVILVVGMKLGCLNHAQLTVEAILADKVDLRGWIANQIDPDMACFQENLAFLQRRIPAPCLGLMAYEQPGSLALEPLLAATP